MDTPTRSFAAVAGLPPRGSLGTAPIGGPFFMHSIAAAANLDAGQQAEAHSHVSLPRSPSVSIK